MSTPSGGQLCAENLRTALLQHLGEHVEIESSSTHPSLLRLVRARLAEVPRGSARTRTSSIGGCWLSESRATKWSTGRSYVAVGSETAHLLKGYKGTKRGLAR